MVKIKKIIGNISHSGKLQICDTEIKAENIDVKIYNIGFDGEKYESAFSFVSSEDSDLYIDFHFDEIEAQRIIGILKKHLKNNRKHKKNN